MTLQARVPEGILGQIFSYDYLVSVALFPFGLLAVPFLADAMGNRTLLLLAGAVSVLGMLALWLLPSVHGMVDEETPDAVLVESAA